MRTVLVLFLALGLVAAACGSDDDTAGTTTTSEDQSDTTTTTAEETTTTAPAGDVPGLASSCTSPDGFSISYPDDWDAVSDCGQFGPAPVEEPAPGTDERPGVVSAFVDRVPFTEVAVPSEDETARATTSVDGLQAVRVTSTSSGAGLRPAGTEIVRWIVDLSIGPDDDARTLFVDAVDVDDEVDFDRAVVVLDAMARSLDIRAGDEPESDTVVARFEGGGAPVTVAAAPSASTPASCLRLLDVDRAIACVEAVDSPDGASVTQLEGPTGPLLVGISGSDVWAVDTVVDDVVQTHLPVPYPARDSRGFAFPFGPDAVDALTLRAIDGTVLAEVTIDEATRPAG